MKLVGVKINGIDKVTLYEVNGIEFQKDDYIVVETEDGYAYGLAVMFKETPCNKSGCFGKVVRRATKLDKDRNIENIGKEKKAYKTCVEKIKEHGLQMKLVQAQYKFDNSKLTFSFTAEGRIDFRELVKDLAAIFRTRIELRQIGTRDEVKRIGGNGMCGRELCCCSHLKNFETVSIKMAKEQNIALNPSKITGNCGRLMCCLKYEQEVYEEKISKLPKIGAIVKTIDGTGEICSIETLAERIKVKIGKGEESVYKKYNVQDIEVIKDGKETISEE